MRQNKRILIYIVNIIVIVFAIVFVCRLPVVSEYIDWRTAVSDGSASAYREFYAKWRTGNYADEALAGWKQQLKKEYNEVDWTSPIAVDVFIRTHPEYREKDIRETQYDAVLNNGSYRVLNSYLQNIPLPDRRTKIEELIDTLAMSEVGPAINSDDYQALERLPIKYSDWRFRKSRIDEKIKIARNNAAKKEWERVSESKSEVELIEFKDKFYDSIYADLATRRIELLYKDFDYVKSKGTLKAYIDFVNNNPNSPQIDEARKCLEDELVNYIFQPHYKRLHDDLVRSALSQYAQVRPVSGTFYGRRGYHSSPLRVTTPEYGFEDYYIKLVNKWTDESVAIYVRAGSTVEVSIPDGTYSMRYATGLNWYGSRLLFGLNTHCSKSNDEFIFENGRGYSLTLQKVAHGNLHTSTMDASEF